MHRRNNPLALALLLAAFLAGCSPEADLVAYFGTPSPPAPSPTPPPGSPDPTPSAPATGEPTAEPTTPAPPPASPSVEPSPTNQPAATPAWSSMPTRPPGLAEFGDLRDAADVTDVSRLASNPDGLLGATVYFEGRVNQVVENGSGRVRARVKIGEALVYLVYRTDRYWGDHPLVQGDRIRVVGEFIGMSSAADGERLPEIEPIDMIHRFA